MASVGGNTRALLQTRGVIRNEIGEDVKDWGDICTLTGWLDLQSGDSKYTNYNAKVEESSHLFLCDYVKFDRGLIGGPAKLGKVTNDNSRLIIEGQVYNVLLIDDPMNMHDHLEIHLRYIGGQDNEEQYTF